MKKALLTLFIFIFSLPCVHAQKEEDFIVFETNNKVIYDICFTDRGEALGIADNNAIKVYSTNSKILLNEFTNGHKRQILSIDISKDSTLLVSGGKDSTIVIWDFVNNEIKESLSFHKGIITSVQISPDNKYLVSGGTDNKVCLYDLEQNQVVHEFTDHKDDITSVKFSPDGVLIATASGDKLINIYEVKNKRLITSLNEHRSWVRDITFSPDGSRLISCGDDSKVITWNISDVENIQTEKISNSGSGWLLGVDFNEDSITYVYGGIGGKAKIITHLGDYFVTLNKPIHRIKFKPNEAPNLIIALATLGKGVILIDAKNMKFKNK